MGCTVSELPYCCGRTGASSHTGTICLSHRKRLCGICLHTLSRVCWLLHRWWRQSQFCKRKVTTPTSPSSSQGLDTQCAFPKTHSAAL